MYGLRRLSDEMVGVADVHGPGELPVWRVWTEPARASGLSHEPRAWPWRLSDDTRRSDGTRGELSGIGSSQIRG
jgi:hypothetical protein